MSSSSVVSKISERIARLSDSHRECMVEISRLSRTSGIGTEAARKELATHIHQNLKEAESEMESLNIDIGDLNPTLEPQAALLSKWNKLSDDMKLARSQYRKAQLTAKNDSEAARRKMLFGDSGEPGSGGGGRRRGPRGSEGRKDMSANELVESAANDVTVSLRRTHDLMASELSRSQFASETLAESSATLKQLSTSYSSFDSLLISSRDLITDLVRKNKSDQWYYQMSLYCLISTVIWLIFRRLLYGPLYLLVWLPLKLIWYLFGGLVTSGGKDVAAGQGKSGGKDKVLTGADKVAESVASKMKPEQSVKIPEEPKKREPLTLTMENGETVKVPVDPVDVPADGGVKEQHAQQDWEDKEQEVNDGNHDEL